MAPTGEAWHWEAVKGGKAQGQLVSTWSDPGAGMEGLRGAHGRLGPSKRSSVGGSRNVAAVGSLAEPRHQPMALHEQEGQAEGGV